MAAKIAAAGFEFFQQHVRRSDTHCYMLQLMRALHNMTGSPSDKDLTGFQHVDPLTVFQHLNKEYGAVDDLHDVLPKQHKPKIVAAAKQKAASGHSDEDKYEGLLAQMESRNDLSEEEIFKLEQALDAVDLEEARLKNGAAAEDDSRQHVEKDGL